MSASAPDPFLDQTYARMQGELRWWALGLLALGALNVVAGLQWIWPLPIGVLLVLLAIAGLYFREAGLYVVYLVVLLWAAASSILVNMAGPICLGLGELGLALKLAVDYRRYRRTELDYLAQYAQGTAAGPRPCTRARNSFSWVSAAIGFLALTPRLGLTAVVVSVFTRYAPAVQPVLVAGWLGYFAGGLGALAVALALAALLSGHRWRGAAIAGLAAGAIVTALWLAAMMNLAAVFYDFYSH